ncbi:hypothetical protein ABT026_31945 [Streptomyces sp. NPDC002734]|uniref:hypothetical protein n=1 Tax=Streptomyces sp. NPDC002734 TaxID=3154426 RepID=UPI003316F2F6
MARTRNSLLAVALLALLGLTSTACNGDSDSADADSKPKATVSAPQEEETGTEESVEDDETIIVALDKPAEWRNGVSAKLSKFTRGKSGQWASPSNTQYLKFNVTVTNDSKKPLDLGMMVLVCPAGGDEIFDGENGLDGAPSSHVLPGEKGTWTAACAFGPKDNKSSHLAGRSPNLVALE